MLRFGAAVTGLKQRCRGLILVDEPTSKPKIVLDGLEMVWKAVTNAVPEEVKYVSVGITVGRRFELVPLVTARLQKLVPDRQPYIISMTAGEAQSRNKRPSYLIFPSLPACREGRCPHFGRLQCVSGLCLGEAQAEMHGQHVQAAFCASCIGGSCD